MSDWLFLLYLPLGIVLITALDQIIDQHQINKWEREHEEDDE